MSHTYKLYLFTSMNMPFNDRRLMAPPVSKKINQSTQQWNTYADNIQADSETANPCR